MIISFGHLTTAQSALVTSLATVIGTVVVIVAGAMEHKPVSMQAITGVTVIIVADLALFGIRMDPEQRGAVAAAAGVFAGLALHMLHVTVTAAPAPLTPLVSGTGTTPAGVTGTAPEDLGPHRPSALLAEDAPTEVTTRRLPGERF